MKLCCCGMVASTAPRRSARIASSGQVRKVASSILCTKEEKKSSSIRFKMKAGKTISKNLVEKVVSTMPRKDKLSNSKQPVEKKVKVPKVFASLSRDLESKYMKPNHRYIIGVDEAGRGPLAGPVVAAACVIEGTVDIEGIIDSKATTEQSRVDTFQKLVNTPGIFYDVIRIEHNEIDEINILQASLKAMRLATEGVLRKMKEQHDMNAAGFEKLCVALVDGNRVPADMPLETMCVIKGDSVIYSIAAASIIAKVSRDRIMTEYDALYPQYGLAQHKGYPTAMHRGALLKHGPCPIHRMTYGPVKVCLNKTDATK